MRIAMQWRPTYSRIGCREGVGVLVRGTATAATRTLPTLHTRCWPTARLCPAAKPSDIESDYHDDSAGGGSRAAAPSLTRLIDESRRARRPHGPPPGALGYEELAALQKLDPTVWPTPDSAGAGSSEGTAAATAAVSHATGSTVVNGGVGPGAAEALRRLWGGDDDGGDGDEEAADAEPVYVPTDFRRPRPVVPDPSAGVEAMGTYAPTADTLTTVPCGTCRVRSQCRPGGVVSPETCVYISHWLQW